MLVTSKLKYSKLWFSKFKKIVSSPVFRELQLTHISLNFQTFCCNLKVRGLLAKLCVTTLYYSNFERNYDVSKSKSICILLKKIWTLIKTKRNWKWKIPHTVLKRRTLCCSSYNNRKLKIKLWWKKKEGIFMPFVLSEGNFLTFVFYLSVSICILYCIHFQNIHTFLYIKEALLHTFFCLFLKLSKAFSVPLKAL